MTPLSTSGRCGGFFRPGRAAPPDDQRQAEFQRPGRYFAEAQLASLAKNGRELLLRWAPVLEHPARSGGRSATSAQHCDRP
ncbi:hypothetical protein J4G37_61565, partial [Microvirga sp. 3-52]|nr:hypothetical protein [Microvirga sp. 3-52]